MQFACKPEALFSRRRFAKLRDQGVQFERAGHQPTDDIAEQQIVDRWPLTIQREQPALYSAGCQPESHDTADMEAIAEC